LKYNTNRSGRESIDDVLFENRNKEYGSYFLRKRFHVRLALSFLITLSVTLLFLLGYLWYLNEAGDESVYMYAMSPYELKDADASLMSAGELEDFLQQAPREKVTKTEITVNSSTDFTVVENVTRDSFTLSETEALSPDSIDVYGPGEDSVLFGGFLQGTGSGNGPGGQIDRLPEFPLGNPTRYVERHLKYPPQAIKQKIHGIVIISFIINKSGEVTNVKVEKGVDPLIDAEAVKTILGMPNWKPGMMKGKPVNIQFRIPINFIPLS